MEGADLKLAYQVLRDVLMVIGFAWMIISNRSRATRDEIDGVRRDHDGRLNTHGERLTRLEGKIEDLPDDVKHLHGRISKLGNELDATGNKVAELTGRLDGLSELFKRLERVTERQEKFLLERDR